MKELGSEFILVPLSDNGVIVFKKLTFGQISGSDFQVIKVIKIRMEQGV